MKAATAVPAASTKTATKRATTKRASNTTVESGATGVIDPVDVAGRLRLGVTRLARILRQQDSASLGPTLSSALATVNHEGPLTLGDLSAREHISPPSVTKVVEKLVAAGYISRRVDEHDRRVTMVQVTDAGRAHIAETRSRRTAWLATRVAELSDDDLARLAAGAEVLERLTQVVTVEVTP